MGRVIAKGPLANAELDAVFIWTHDLKRMKRFYRDLLGLKVTYENPHFVSLQGRGASIALHDETRSHAAGDNWFMEFLVEDLDAVVADLARRGVSVDPIRKERFGRITAFRDPEGNEIGLEEPPRRRR